MRLFVINLLLITLWLIVGGCDNFKGQDGNSCSFSKEVDRTIVNCTDGSSTVIMDGAKGSSGLDGEDGQDSTSSCSVTKVLNVTTVSCTNGTTATVVDGQDGDDSTIPGPSGHPGPIGSTGPSYSPTATIIPFSTNGLCKSIGAYYVQRASSNLDFYSGAGCTGNKILRVSTMVQLSSTPLSMLYVAFMLSSPATLTATIITF